MWVKALMYSMLALLDLTVIALIGTQLSSHKTISWNLILPTIVFNLFGAYLLRIVDTKR
jgi:hypothetical protein